MDPTPNDTKLSRHRRADYDVVIRKCPNEVESGSASSMYLAFCLPFGLERQTVSNIAREDGVGSVMWWLRGHLHYARDMKTGMIHIHRATRQQRGTDHNEIHSLEANYFCSGPEAET
jgi:hypothetical protein